MDRLNGHRGGPWLTAREKIEAWLKTSALMGADSDLRWRISGRLARAALEIIDAEHTQMKDGSCGGCSVDCGCTTSRVKWPCPRKAEHEAALWEAIHG